jgi:hypothetical protein
VFTNKHNGSLTLSIKHLNQTQFRVRHHHKNSLSQQAALATLATKSLLRLELLLYLNNLQHKVDSPEQSPSAQ